MLSSVFSRTIHLIYFKFCRCTARVSKGCSHLSGFSHLSRQSVFKANGKGNGSSVALSYAKCLLQTVSFAHTFTQALSNVSNAFLSNVHSHSRSIESKSVFHPTYLPTPAPSRCWHHEKMYNVRVITLIMGLICGLMMMCHTV